MPNKIELTTTKETEGLNTQVQQKSLKEIFNEYLTYIKKRTKESDPFEFMYKGQEISITQEEVANFNHNYIYDYHISDFLEEFTNSYFNSEVEAMAFGYAAAASFVGLWLGLGFGSGAFLAGLIPMAGPALYGMAVDISQTCKELIDNQRVWANLSTLLLSTAYVAGATIAAMAWLASNPIGWGIVGVSVLAISVAALVKITRYVATKVDAEMNKNNPESFFPGDSRFKVTDKLISQEAGSECSPNLNTKAVKEILMISAAASKYRKFGLFGERSDYGKLVSAVEKINYPEKFRRDQRWDDEESTDHPSP